MTGNELAALAKIFGAYDHVLHDDGRFTLSFMNSGCDRDPETMNRMIREGLRTLLPFVVELPEFLTMKERRVLDEALAPESLQSESFATSGFTFCKTPLWDRNGTTLFFRSETEFIVATMLVERIRKNADLAQPNNP